MATSDDESGVRKFLEKNLPQREILSDIDYFRWRHRKGPWGDAIEDSVVLTDGEKLNGYMGAIRDRLWSGTHWESSRWLVNLWIEPQHRGGLECLQMLRAAMEGSEAVLATGINPRMLPIYRSLGWHQIDTTNTFFFVIRPASIIRLANESEDRKTRAWWKPVAQIANCFSLPARWLLNPRSRGRCVVDTVDYSVADELFARCLPDLGVTTDRGRAMLEWKIGQRVSGTVLQVSIGTAESVSGHLIVKLMERPGVARWLEIVDYLLEPDVAGDLLHELLRGAVGFAFDQDCDFIRFRLSHQPDVAAMTRQRWWIRAPHQVSDDVFCYHEDPNLLQQLASQSWYLTSWVSDRCDYGGDDGSLR